MVQWAALGAALCVRFDNEAHGPNGEKIYANRVIIWARTRWGKIVEQRDFYEDTARITELEARLQDLGVLACKTPEPLPGDQ